MYAKVEERFSNIRLYFSRISLDLGNMVNDYTDVLGYTRSPTCLINGCRLSYNKQILKCFPASKNAGENFVVKICSKWVTSKNEVIPKDMKNYDNEKSKGNEHFAFSVIWIFCSHLIRNSKKQVNIMEFWILHS